MKEFFSAKQPPNNCRNVVLNFGDNGERDCIGFYWSTEGSWYRQDGSKRRSNAVHPVQWKEVEK